MADRPDSAAQAALAGSIRRPVDFAFLDIAGAPMRVTNAPYDITFNDTGDPDLDGFTFEALDPRFVGVGEVKLSEKGADTVTLKLSGLAGLDDETMNEIGDKSRWQGRDARLWKGMLDPQTLAQLGAVWCYHTGVMAVPRVSWQDTYVIPRELKISTLEDVERILALPGAPFEGATVVDPAASDLATARSRAWNAAKAARDACANGGCATALGRVDTTDRSRILIAGAVQMAQIAQAAGEPYSVDWVMADNQPVAHDAAQMISLGLAVGQHIAECWDRAQQLRVEIDAAADVGTIAAIDITSGWPGTPAT